MAIKKEGSKDELEGVRGVINFGVFASLLDYGWRIEEC